MRAKREVLNYFAGLRFVERNAGKKTISHEEILRLHKILAGDVMDQGTAGRYRTMAVRVGQFVPPPPEDVSGLMFELLTWWNRKSGKLSPVLSSAILHYRFERFIRLPMATDGQVAHWRYGSFIGAGSIRIIFFRWTNFIGRIVPAITRSCRRCGGRVKI